MSTGPRRLLVTALLSLLVGLGVLKALFGGRRQQPRSLAGVEELVPLSNPPPGQRAGGRRGLAAALVLALLLTGLAGIVYESRDALFGAAPRRTDGSGSPLAILSGPETDAGHKPGAHPSPAPTPEAVPLPKAEAPDGSLPAAEAARQAEAAPVSPQAPPAPSIPAVREPSFDVVRVDPNGDALVAGRAAPDSIVDLLVDGKPVASAKADAGGWFTFMPSTLPTGSSEIGLRARDAQGAAHRSPAKVAVVVAPSRDEKPLVAVTSPGQPTLVLSQPDRPPATHPGAVAQSGGAATTGTETEPSPDATRGADRSGSARTEAPVASGTGSPETAPTPERDTIASGRNRAEAPAGLPGTADRTDPTTITTKAATPSKETPPKIVSIDAQEGGRLFVTARGAPGAAMRLYLNDTLIAPATVGRDGTVTFTIGQGVRPGAYKVRLDLVDSVTGKVRDRAEVPFAAPAPGRDDGVEYAAGPPDSGREIAPPDASLPPGTGTAQARRDAPADRAPPPSSTGSLAAQTTTVPGGTAGSSEVYVPGIETARIVRGDSLWKISRRTYGEGLRYTLIYDANQDQIRDPDLIYPGQVFVLPGKGIPETAAAPEGTGPRE